VEEPLGKKDQMVLWHLKYIQLVCVNVKVSGQWRNVTEGLVKVSGTWRSVQSVYVKVNGVWRVVDSAGDLTSLIFYSSI